MLIAGGKTGYMASIQNTTAPADKWVAGGIPITMMMKHGTSERENETGDQKNIGGFGRCSIQLF